MSTPIVQRDRGSCLRPKEHEALSEYGTLQQQSLQLVAPQPAIERLPLPPSSPCLSRSTRGSRAANGRCALTRWQV
jgi:hypothetical protein